MKVYNKEKTQVLENYDLENGKLITDFLITLHPEQIEVKEKSHYKVVKEYSNGGKDVEKVIDVEYVPYIKEYEEKEEILIYIPYTKEELLKKENEKIKDKHFEEMAKLEQWFNNYDLQVKQYERATRLGETFDKDIKMLDNEAREKASRVKELRKLLEG